MLFVKDREDYADKYLVQDMEAEQQQAEKLVEMCERKSSHTG